MGDKNDQKKLKPDKIIQNQKIFNLLNINNLH